MFCKRFLLNDETLPVIEQIGSHMPGGFFIYEATRRIRAMDRADSKEIPIIALTANVFGVIK